jgi:hypothetical protein
MQVFIVGLLLLALCSLTLSLNFSDIVTFNTPSSTGYAITRDTAGYLYVTGSFSEGDAMFGSFNLTNNGKADVFVVKYHPTTKEVVWAVSAGGPAFDQAKGICFGDKHVYVTGMYQEGANFGEYENLSTSALFGMFTMKVSIIDGSIVKLHTSSMGFTAVGTGIACGIDSVFVTGYFSAEGSFDDFNVTSQGGNDIFLVKYAYDGEEAEFVQTAGSTTNDQSNGVAVSANNVFITGQFSGPIQFGLHYLDTNGSSDIFIAGLSQRGGDWLFAQSDGAGSIDKGLAITAIDDETVFATGVYRSSDGADEVNNVAFYKVVDGDIVSSQYLLENAQGNAIAVTSDQNYVIITGHKDQAGTILLFVDAESEDVNMNYSFIMDSVETVDSQGYGVLCDASSIYSVGSFKGQMAFDKGLVIGDNTMERIYIATTTTTVPTICFGQSGDAGCNGNGKCISTDHCECNSDWTGIYCNETNPVIVTPYVEVLETTFEANRYVLTTSKDIMADATIVFKAYNLEGQDVYEYVDSQNQRFFYSLSPNDTRHSDFRMVQSIFKAYSILAENRQAVYEFVYRFDNTLYRYSTVDYLGSQWMNNGFVFYVVATDCLGITGYKLSQCPGTLIPSANDLMFYVSSDTLQPLINEYNWTNINNAQQIAPNGKIGNAWKLSPRFETEGHNSTANAFTISFFIKQTEAFVDVQELSKGVNFLGAYYGPTADGSNYTSLECSVRWTAGKANIVVLGASIDMGSTESFLNQWNHIAITVSKSKVTAYVNGGTVPTSRSPAIATSFFQNGLTYGSDKFFHTDEFAIFNTVLSISEIQLLKRAYAVPSTDITCYGISKNDPTVCSGNGTCIGQDICLCPGYSSTCSHPVCYDITADQSTVCHSRGKCQSPNTCVCTENYFGVMCEFTTCYGVTSNYSSVCNSHGYCTSVDVCTCFDGYKGQTCNETVCFNIDPSDSKVCSGHGACVGPDKCQCQEGWTGYLCNIPVCYGTLATEKASVCTGHGVCQAPDQCTCFENYAGSKCEISTCFNISSNSSQVCSTHGQCVDTDNCVCSNGWTGPMCDVVSCYGISYQNSTVCSSHGSCTGPNQCSCSTPSSWTGSKCDVPVCSNVAANVKRVCGGSGTCTAPNTCVCNSDSYGTNCGSVRPIAVVASKQSVYCGNARLDGSQSYSLTDNNDLSFSWTATEVIGSTNETSKQEILSQLNTYLKKKQGVSGYLVEVPVSMLPPLGQSVKIQLIATSSSSIPSQPVYTVLQVSSSIVSGIKLAISGQATQTVARSSYVSLSGTATISSCMSTSSLSVEYKWVQTSGTSIKFNSAWSNVADINFAPNTFSQSGDYVFTLQGRVKGTSAVTEASATLTVLLSNLKASIANSARVVSSAQFLVLDASGSTDPEKLSNIIGSTFSWSCAMGSGNTTDGCGSNLNDIISQQKSSQLTIPAGSLSAPSNYQFTVTYTVKDRSATATAYIEVLNSAVPSVNLYGPASPVIKTENRYYGMRNTISFYATVSSSEAGCRWTLNDGNVMYYRPYYYGYYYNLYYDPNSQAQYMDNTQLYLYTDVLLVGQMNKVRLVCTSSSGAQGYAEYSFMVLGQPPQPGIISVYPPTGDMSTTFTMSALGWIQHGSEYYNPFYGYTFSYYAPPLQYSWTIKDSNGREISSSASVSNNQFSTQLSAGTNFITVTVRNQYGMSNSLTTSVQVSAIEYNEYYSMAYNYIYYYPYPFGFYGLINYMNYVNFYRYNLCYMYCGCGMYYPTCFRRSLQDSNSAQMIAESNELNEKMADLLIGQYSTLDSDRPLDTSFYSQMIKTLNSVIGAGSNITEAKQREIFDVAEQLIMNATKPIHTDLLFYDVHDMFIDLLEVFIQDNDYKFAANELIDQVVQLVVKDIPLDTALLFNITDTASKYATSTVPSAISEKVLYLGRSEIFVTFNNNTRDLLSSTNNDKVYVFANVANLTSLIAAGVVPEHNEEDSHVISDVLDIRVDFSTDATDVFDDFNGETFFAMQIPISSGIPNGYHASCRYLNTLTKKWVVDGCSVQETTSNTVKCACSHMSQFVVTYDKTIVLDSSSQIPSPSVSGPHVHDSNDVVVSSTSQIPLTFIPFCISIVAALMALAQLL